VAGKIDQAYERHRPTALRVLRRRCPWLAADERLGVYHDAFATLLEKDRDGALDVEAMHDAQVRGYLLTAAVHRGLGEGARAERRRAVPTADPGLGVVDPARPMEDRVEDELGLLAVRELVEELPERRRAVIKLRFWFDRSPDEIKAFLGISERAYRKEIERAFAQLADRYELVRQGRWCEERRSLVLAYLAGVAGSRRTREAQLHLKTCPGCAHMARELRRTAEQVAAVLPMPIVSGRDLGLVADFGIGIKSHLSDLIGGAKANVAGVAARADPSVAGYAAGTRPGAAVAAIASCVAIGGGATYCAVEGLPDPLYATAPTEHRPPPEPEKRDPPPTQPVGRTVAETATSDESRPKDPGDGGSSTVAAIAPETLPPLPLADPATEFAPAPTAAPPSAESAGPADASAPFASDNPKQPAPATREFSP